MSTNSTAAVTGGRNAVRVEHDRNATIKAIKSALKRRSGKAWGVTGGRGTAWDWIEITAPPARRTSGHDLLPGAADIPENYIRNDTKYPEGGASMTDSDKIELGRLLGLDRCSYDSGESIPADGDYRREYIDRAEGRSPSVIGEQYWD